MTTIKYGDRVIFVKYDKRMNSELARLVGKEGKVTQVAYLGNKWKAAVEFGILDSWWINLSRLELQIPCYTIPHMFGENGKCLHCGEPKVEVVNTSPCPLDHKELSQTGTDVCPECQEVTR